MWVTTHPRKKWPNIDCFGELILTFITQGVTIQPLTKVISFGIY